MERFKKARDIIENGWVDILWSDDHQAQLVVFNDQYHAYLVTYSYGVWYCDPTCPDWHHRGKDGQIKGSFNCKHLLASMIWLYLMKVIL